MNYALKPDVDGVDVEVCHEHCHRAAAAEVNASEFAVLPNDLLIVEKVVNFSHILSVCVRCAAFATVSGEFGDNHAIIEERRIVALKNFGERWVKCRIDIRAQATAVAHHGATVAAECFGDVFEEVFEV